MRIMQYTIKVVNDYVVRISARLGAVCDEVTPYI